MIELLATLAIMGVLAMVSVPMLQLTIQRQKEQELSQALFQIREAIDAYKRAVDQGHISLRVGESGYPPSLDALVNGIEDEKSPVRKKMFFLRKLPFNPMSSNSGLDPSKSWGLRSYESTADNPQEGSDVFDVYCPSDKVGLNGLAYKQW